MNENNTVIEITETQKGYNFNVNKPMSCKFDEIETDIKDISQLKEHIQDKINYYQKEFNKCYYNFIPPDKDIVSPYYHGKNMDYGFLLALVIKYEDHKKDDLLLINSLLDILNDHKFNDGYKSHYLPSLPLLDILYQTLSTKKLLDYFYNSDLNKCIKIKKNNVQFDDELYQKKIKNLKDIHNELTYYTGDLSHLDIPKKPKDTLVDIQDIINLYLPKDIKKFRLKDIIHLIIDDHYKITNIEQSYSKSRNIESIEAIKKLPSISG